MIAIDAPTLVHSDEVRGVRIADRGQRPDDDRTLGLAMDGSLLADQ